MSYQTISFNNKIYFSELSFIIEKDGSLSSIKAEGDEKGFNTEVMNAFKKMKTEWIAARNTNRAVRYHVSIPITYSQIKMGKANSDRYRFFGDKK